MFAGGMQALGRARIIGERTAGAVLPSTVTRLPNGDHLQYAVGSFITPLGETLEGDGVRPEQIVPLGRADLLAGRDTKLEEAMEWIRSHGSH